MLKELKKQTLLLLLIIFLVGLFVRFLYFPQNVYFAFDQARDAFISQQIPQGHLKIVGPPSAANDKLFPGPLIYYILGPLYFIFDKNPEVISAFLRIYNLLGIPLVFLLGQVLFNKRVAILASLFFAISYEQTQYSLFISHQPMAVLTVLLFYLGLALFIFKQQQKGLIIAVAGLGLSIQFHYVYLLLIPVLILLFAVFKDRLKNLKFKYVLYSLAILLVTLSTYIVSELKFNFRFLQAILSQFTMGDTPTKVYPQETLFIINRFIHDTIIANFSLTIAAGFFIVILCLFFLTKSHIRPKIIFLLCWFLGGLIPYFLSGTPSYYYSATATVSLLLFISFVADHAKNQWKIMVVALVLANNLYLIKIINPQGPNTDMVIQPGMTTSSEKAALDYVYSQTGNTNFAVNALTIPLNINTTWNYLFEWYGQKKYGYLPVWGGDSAEGFPGNIPVQKDRSKLPQTQFLIIEPTIGIREGVKTDFLREENYFTKVIDEQYFGTITVQKRQKF